MILRKLGVELFKSEISVGLSHSPNRRCWILNNPHRLFVVLPKVVPAKQRCYSSYVVESPHKPIEIPNSLIPELIWDTVDRFPEATALKCGLTGRSLTFAEVQKQSQQLAFSLRKMGLKQGEVVALVLPNCPEFAVIVLGVLEAGCVISLINHVYTADEICHQLKDSGSVLVITAPEKLDVVKVAITKVEKATQSKQIRQTVAVDGLSNSSLPPGTVRFSDLVGKGIDTLSNGAQGIESSQLAVLPYSSGTTGLSKGVALSHRNIVSNILQVSSIEELKYKNPDEGQDIVMGVLPFYHIYGLTVALINSLYVGTQCLTLPKFEKDSFLSSLENNSVSVLLMVPPLILFLGSEKSVTSRHMRNVRFLVSGAAPLGASDLEKILPKIPAENKCIVYQAYGMTELSPVVTVPLLPCKDLATVGVPIPNTQGKIVDPETGKSVGPNQLGELCFRGPQVMLGYHNNPKATAEMIDSEGWLRTGDIGYYDDDKHFYIKDRLKELIKVKGFQVPPAELEELIRMHPRVIDVGVIGVPCPRAGEVPVAYVVPRKGEPLTAEDVKDFLSDRVSKHKQLAQVIFVDNIPKSAAGKILRKELRQLYKNTQTLT